MEVSTTTHRSNDRRIRFLAMSGSLPKASSNTGLLRAGQELDPEGMEITIFDISLRGVQPLDA